MKNYQIEKGKEKNDNTKFGIKILNKFVMLYLILI